MKKQGLLIGALACVAVAAVAVGSTFAFLSGKTAPKQNVFTAAANLQGEIRELAFDGKDYGETRGANETYATNLGIERAKKVVPGRVVPKNPQVKNTSASANGLSAWIAVKLDVKCGGKTGAEAMALIGAFADIDFDLNNWEAADDGVTYYYKTVVAPQGQTEPLFSAVTIKESVSPAAIQNFELNPTAYLVQGEGAEGAATLAEAKALFQTAFADFQ